MTDIDPVSLFARLTTEQAHRQGFDACAIASATAPIDPDNRLGAWLDRGYQGEMDWIEQTRDLRRDVHRMLPGLRSVVTVAKSYYVPRKGEPGPGQGRVSRYAWGRDYHNAMRKPLKRLAAFVEDLQEGARCRIAIDTAPVMERAWAARAGLGWTGKNGLLLRNDLGSWFFLGVVLTTVAMEPDAPVPERCGTCTRCMDACPTGAIVAPGVVDARRCISYLTIEHRGAISNDLATSMQDWVFGCDVCQEVCPWNADVSPTKDQDYYPRDGHDALDLAGIKAMSEQDFLARFAGSPIRRAGLDGLRRNAEAVHARRRPE